MKKILVTGGTGFIGRHTLAPLLANDYEIHVATSRVSASDNKQITMHQIDLLDCTAHQILMDQLRPSHLLHSAWYTENGKFWDAIENVHWLKATISLADAFFKAGGQRLVGLGTCAEYDWRDGLCIENHTAEIPASLYGKTKLSAYQCLTALANAYKRELAWARIFFPYGAGEHDKRLIPYVISRLLRNEMALCTQGNQIRDFMHVSDMGEALTAIINSKITGAINVGSGTPVTIREIVEQIAVIMGKEDMINLGAVKEVNYPTEKILADASRLKKEANWSARLSLSAGLSQTIDWWRESVRLTEESI